MKRQLTFTVYEYGLQQMEQAADGRYDLKRVPLGTVEATSFTKADIRAAIIAQGLDCPKGTDVYANKVGKVQYKFTTEKLLEIADERIELPLD